MTNRTALVGGGSSGIGLATARQLAAAGVDVVLMGRTAERLAAAAATIERPAGGRVDHVVGDVADPAAAEAVIDSVEQRVGPLDILILNAGGPPPGRILEVGAPQWDAGVQLLLLGPLRFARVVLPRMATRHFGRLVVVTSTAVRQPQPDLALSVVLRSAVTSAAKLLSREYASDGVTVNCVAPGATATDRRAQILANRAESSGTSVDDMDRADTASVPAGRAGSPDEVAAAITFLASDAASYINGTVITADGGRTETTW